MVPRNVVALKVKILQKGADWPITEERGHALYPNFNQLPSVNASGLDWSKYIDVHGEGWQYDKTCGHRDEGIDSPRGTQWGMLLIPQEFANEAIAAFPAICSKMSEAEVEAFWNNCAHAHEPDEHIDKDVLEGIAAKKAADIPLTLGQKNALDPSSKAPGLRKNHRRYWADYKAKHNLKVLA